VLLRAGRACVRSAERATCRSHRDGRQPRFGGSHGGAGSRPARDGWERGYALVFIEDAMAGLSAEAHAFAVHTIFPRIGRVRSTAEVLAALARAR
jgi:isochorismatase family protein